MDEAAGFWTGKGAPALHDWCEPNYVVTPWIAEFWNTTSSLWMVVLAVYGLWRWKRRGDLGARFAVLLVGLLFVGVGSVAFHGTLLRIPQALDELPMIYTGLMGAWVLLQRHDSAERGRWLAWFFVLYAAIFTAAYIWLPGAFAIFLISYVVIVTWVTLKSIALTWLGQPAQGLIRFLLLGAGYAFLGTWVLAWIPEHVLLPCDHPAQALHLHSWWHLGAGTGTYLWILWAIGDRWRAGGVAAQWDRGFVEPDGTLDA